MSKIPNYLTGNFDTGSSQGHYQTLGHGTQGNVINFGEAMKMGFGMQGGEGFMDGLARRSGMSKGSPTFQANDGSNSVLMNPQQGYYNGRGNPVQGVQGNNFSGTSQPKFSDMASIVNPAQTGAGTVLRQGTDMFAPANQNSGFGQQGNFDLGFNMPTRDASAFALPKMGSTAQASTPAPSMNHFNPMEDATFGQAVNNNGLIAKNASFDSPSDPKSPGGLSGMADWMNGALGLEGSDALSVGDYASGAMSAIGTGINAYGMFEQLGMMEEQVDQGWANVNLKRDAFKEEKRRHNAGAERNKRA